jgi:hypothetical protein
VAGICDHCYESPGFLKVGKFLSSLETGGNSRRTQFHCVSLGTYDKYLMEVELNWRRYVRIRLGRNGC